MILHTNCIVFWGKCNTRYINFFISILNMQETFPVKVFHFLPLQYSLVEGIMLLWFRSGKDRRLSEMPREPTPVWTMRQDVNLWGFYYAKCFTTVFLFIHARSLTHWWKPTVSGKFGFGVLFKNGSHYQLHHLSLGAFPGTVIVFPSNMCHPRQTSCLSKKLVEDWTDYVSAGELQTRSRN